MSLIWGLGVGLVLFFLLWLNLLSLPGNWLMLGVLCLAAWLGPQGVVTWSFVGLMALIAAAIVWSLWQLRHHTPLTNDAPKLLNGCICLLEVQAEIGGNFPCKLKIEGIVRIRDVELQSVCVSDRVHVIGLRKLPALAGHQNETVVAQMIVRIGDKNVENDTRPKLS